MSRIQVDQAVIIELLKWGIKAGADAMAARKVLQQSGVDPAVYQSVIDDKRTYKNFHQETTTKPVPENVEPGTSEPAGGGPLPGGSTPLRTAVYDSAIDYEPTVRNGYEVGDHVYSAGEGRYWVVAKKFGLVGIPGLSYVRDVAE